MRAKISIKSWGAIAGENIYLFKLENSSGAYVEVTNYGATLVSVVVPDKSANLGNVIIGFSAIDGYLDDKCYIGATIGRYANRISNAKFDLDSVTYQLESNDGKNSNHSGSSGFNNKLFGFECKGDTLQLTWHSADGDGGFPGNLDVKVRYNWNDDNELSIRYLALSDKNTYVNFTNHAYFNLSNGSVNTFDHLLTISAEKIAVSANDHIPTGEIMTDFEYMLAGPGIGEKVKKSDGKIKGVNAYYILDKDIVAANGFAAKLTDEASGRTLTVNTSYPGIFFYTGDDLSSAHLNHNKRYCRPFEGLCLECQHYPDSMNRPEFPSALLPKQQLYNEHISFRFGLQ